ncbi:unnamed protein product [Staurois parvus]|uniref:Upstream stimulatory factor 1 n=1 Tax=Staurois parvus TaxID=386267 RepID=A0ABN9GVI0_9NEOB|nr:unnamed protein product [Staurois parvus]
MTQAVIQGAFTSDEAADTDTSTTETHYTYFPTTAVADTSTTVGTGATATTVVTTQNSEALLGQAASTGQFFVMMSPQEVLQGGAQRSIAPPGPIPTRRNRRVRAPRGMRRGELSTMKWNVAGGTRSITGSFSCPRSSQIVPWRTPSPGQSKGGILSKACDYIQELRQGNMRLAEELQSLEQLQVDNELLRQQVEDLKNKNHILRAQLRHHGVEIIIKNDTR